RSVLQRATVLFRTSIRSGFGAEHFGSEPDRAGTVVSSRSAVATDRAASTAAGAGATSSSCGPRTGPDTDSARLPRWSPDGNYELRDRWSESLGARSAKFVEDPDFGSRCGRYSERESRPRSTVPGSLM